MARTTATTTASSFFPSSDSVSRDTGWTNVYVAEGIDVRVRKIHGIAYLRGSSSSVGISSSDWRKVTAVPLEFAPDSDVDASGMRLSSDGRQVGVRVTTDGSVLMYAPGESTSYWSFSMSWPV